MKTQKFYHLKIHFLNQEYTLGRRVLTELLNYRLNVVGSIKGFYDLRISQFIKEHYPDVKEISFIQDYNQPAHIDGIINFDRWLIKEIKIR